MPINVNDVRGTIKFLLQPTLQEGAAIYTGTTDYASFGILLQNVTETIRITQPNGYTLEATVNPNVSRSATINLVGDADGVIKGAYSLEITAVVTGPTDPGTYRSLPTGHKLEACDVNPQLTAKVSCSCGWIEATGASNWTGWAIDSRTLSITPPPVPGAWAPVSTSSTTVTTGSAPLYNNKTYTANLLVTATRGNLTVQNMAVSLEVKVGCANLCEIVCAMKRLFDMWKAQEGVNAEKASKYENAFQTATALANTYSMELNCGMSGEDAIGRFRKLMSGLGIDGDCCDCCKDDVVVTPTCQGSSPEGGGGCGCNIITLPPDILDSSVLGNDILIVLTADYEFKLRNMYVTEVASADGSIAVALNPVNAVLDINKYDLKVANQEYYWRFRFDVTFNNLLNSVASVNFYQHQRSPAVNFWSPTDPVVDTQFLGAINGMRIKNLFSNPVAVHPTMYADVKMLWQQATVPNQPPNIWINAITDILFWSYTASSGTTATDIFFQDLRSNHATYGKIPMSFTGPGGTLPPGPIGSLASTLTTISFQVELRMPRP